MTPEQVLNLIRENEVAFVDLQFTDLPGRLRHISISPERLSPQVFYDGWPLDAAGMELGAQADAVRLRPAPETAYLDPFAQHATIGLICDVLERDGADWQATGARAVAQRVTEYLRTAGVAETAHFATEMQYHVFDCASFSQSANRGHYVVESREGHWASGRDDPDNLGVQLHSGSAAFAQTPADSLHNLRAETVAALAHCGIDVVAHAHGPGAAGQVSIALELAELLPAADALVRAKYVARNAAARHGKVVSFMPQPLIGEPGSGLRTTFALAKGGRSLFSVNVAGGDEGDAASAALDAFTQHIGAVLAFTNPTTNSYRRLAGCPACLSLRCGAESATPLAGDTSGSFELFWPDGTCNPYLAFAAMALAASDGLQNPANAAVTARERAIERAPHTLAGAIAALHDDQDFLTAGEVFPAHLLERWSALKRAEVAELSRRPHPYEFSISFDL